MIRSDVSVAAISLFLIACSGGDGTGSNSPDALVPGDSDAGVAGMRGGGNGGASNEGGHGGSVGTDGGPRDAAADVYATDGGGPLSFSMVQPLLAMNCVRCHDPAHPFVPETTTYVAMDLTAKNAYAALVNKNATQTCGGKLVMPGEPHKSYLYAKITQDAPCFGQRMPHQGMIRTQPLSADQIAIVERWISGGAKP